MYMFKLLRHQLGAGKDCDNIDWEHIVVSNIIKRQSEHDFPQGSMCNRLIDGTKCQSSEQKEICFAYYASRTKPKREMFCKQLCN
jgi:hypothetical protein